MSAESRKPFSIAAMHFPEMYRDSQGRFRLQLCFSLSLSLFRRKTLCGHQKKRGRWPSKGLGEKKADLAFS